MTLPPSDPDGPDPGPETEEPTPGRLTLPVLATGGVCIGAELILAAADAGMIGTPLWRSLAYQYGAFWPGLLSDWVPNYGAQPALMFVTYAFLHAGIGHLFGNMVTLLVLGELVVERVGQGGFLVIYVLSALVGAAVYAAVATGPQPMVGASGALFGLAGAWLYWDYAAGATSRIRLLLLTRAVLGIAGINLMFWWLMSGHVAWQSHVGGAVAGWFLAAALPQLPDPRA